MIRPVTTSDAAAIAEIYNHYVRSSVITFEEKDVSVQQMSSRIRELAVLALPYLACEESGVIVGYAYATPWKARAAYRFSVESTVYIAPGATGRGLGSRLYGALLAALRERRVHSVMGGIALPNAASVGLHEKFGFRKVAEFREVGFKFDRWHDVGYWQAILNVAASADAERVGQLESAA